MEKNCLLCGLLFKKKVNCSRKDWLTTKFCSKQCAKKVPPSDETKLKQRLAKLGKPTWNKGKKLSEEHRKNLCKKKPMSLEGKLRIRNQFRTGKRRVWNKRNLELSTPFSRKSPEYKEWRKVVFERDNYVCTWCGVRGGNLEADHIKSVSLFPQLMLNPNNGRTLCVSCHKKTDTWGAKSWKINQNKK